MKIQELLVEISFPVSEIVCGTFQVLGFSSVSLIFLLVFQVVDKTTNSDSNLFIIFIDILFSLKKKKHRDIRFTS